MASGFIIQQLLSSQHVVNMWPLWNRNCWPDYANIFTIWLIGLL